MKIGDVVICLDKMMGTIASLDETYARVRIPFAEGSPVLRAIPINRLQQTAEDGTYLEVLGYTLEYNADTRVLKLLQNGTVKKERSYPAHAVPGLLIVRIADEIKVLGESPDASLLRALLKAEGVKVI